MIRIMLVEDHTVVRNGYRRLFDAEEDMKVVAEAASADEAYACLSAGDVDLAVVDLNLRGSSGLDAIRRMLARERGLKILVISMHDNPSYVTQAIRLGALGYVTKCSEPDEMLEAIRQVTEGRRFLSADIAQVLASAALEGDALLARLTPKEFDVLCMVVTGESTTSVAETLHLSPKTIYNHMTAIRQKLEVDNDFKLIQLAARFGLVQLSQR
ncbi:MAG: response regulator transcription factor [Proteobacteria bacterium]|nr:response regulator transcription factor [Pseudomonadota bacterium]